MTLRETAAYNAGIEAMKEMALIAAVAIEVRDDARDLRQQAAMAALVGLAEGSIHLKLEMLSPERHCTSVDLYNRATDDGGDRVGP